MGRKTDGTLTEDANQIAEAHMEYWQKIFSRDGNGAETIPSPIKMDNIIKKYYIRNNNTTSSKN